MGNGRDVELDIIGHDHTGHATRSAGNNFDRLERKMRRFNTKAGLDSASSFTAGFLNTISLGRLGSGTALKLAPEMAKAGSRLGILAGGALAGAILFQTGTVLQAGLSGLLGGALLAGPLIYMWKTQEKAVAKLKGEAKSFMAFISKPVEIPFLKSLKEVGKGLEKLKVPVRDMMRQLGPALVPFTKGVMNGLLAFVKALAPAMPGISAGLKTWGEQMPKIGKALGTAFGKILKDPKSVTQSVNDLGDAIAATIDFVGTLAGGLVTLSQKYRQFSHWVDQWENKMNGGKTTGKEFGRVLKFVANAVGHAWQALKRDMGQVAAGFKSMWIKVEIAALSMAKGVLNAFAGMLRGAARAADAIGMHGTADKLRNTAGRIEGQARRIQGAINRLHGKDINIWIRTHRMTYYGGDPVPTNPHGDSSSGSFGFANTAAWRSRAHVVNVAAPVTNVRVMIDGGDLRSRVYRTVVDENKRAAWRARIGSR